MTILSERVDRYVDGIVEGERLKNPNFDLQAGFRSLVNHMNRSEWHSRRW